MHKSRDDPFLERPSTQPPLPPTHPHLQLFAQLGASPLPIVLHASALLEQGHARMFYPFFSYRFFLLPYPDVLLMFYICLLLIVKMVGIIVYGGDKCDG